MKGFGTFALITGICWLVFALNMDVSVATGAGGRVNNLGLMADRQIHTIVGGMIALAGLLMVLLGGKTSATQTAAQFDTRPCPLCAEPIKNAAIKCRHCGANVSPSRSGRSPLTHGWTVQIVCEPWQHAEATKAIKRIGLPLTKGTPKLLIAGPFPSESEAASARESLISHCDLHGEIFLIEPAA
ncbi:hypothetical protein [Pseudomonas alvandae]|uniref:hypothetical protein n=1 Tax=Pseudomonas canavaninivorans TaxID=2842348 RepID=UPI003D65C68C